LKSRFLCDFNNHDGVYYERILARREAKSL